MKRLFRFLTQVTFLYPFIIALFLSGCGVIGPSALPGPTGKNVRQADIVGVWKYPADYRKTAITLELKADGTCVHTIKRSEQSEPQVHTGVWGLEGATPTLKVLKPVFGDYSKPWVLEDARWWIIDSYQEGVDFAICGAADDRDPDSCFEMKKLR